MAISQRDRLFLRLCNEARKDSHDPDRQVGAVIVDQAGQQLSIGTNAPPRLLGLAPADSGAEIRRDPSWKYFMLEHAERNAIFAAFAQGKSLTGATMYGTLFPCADCARAIVASGVARIVVLDGGRDPVRDQKWSEHYRHAAQIFDLAGVTVETVDPKDLIDAL